MERENALLKATLASRLDKLEEKEEREMKRIPSFRSTQMQLEPPTPVKYARDRANREKERGGQKAEPKQWKSNKLEELGIEHFTRDKSMVTSFGRWYQETFIPAVEQRGTSAPNLVIGLLQKHVDRELWENLGEKIPAQERSTNLEKWLGLLNTTYPFLEDPEVWKKQIREAVQQANEPHRAYEARLQRLWKRAYPNSEVETDEAYHSEFISGLYRKLKKHLIKGGADLSKSLEAS
jgi:hypothetical protein